MQQNFEQFVYVLQTVAKVKLLETMTTWQSELERNPCIWHSDSMRLDNLIAQVENLTVCSLHRATPLSDSGIASYPTLHQTSSSCHLLSQLGCLQSPSYPNIIQRILSKISLLVQNLFLLSIKTKLTLRQRQRHQQEWSFRIPIQSRPSADPNTWKGYNSNSHVTSESVREKHKLILQRSFSPTSAVIMWANQFAGLIFAQPLKRGRVYWEGSPLSSGAPLWPLKGCTRAPPL